MAVKAMFIVRQAIERHMANLDALGGNNVRIKAHEIKDDYEFFLKSANRVGRILSILAFSSLALVCSFPSSCSITSFPPFHPWQAVSVS